MPKTPVTLEEKSEDLHPIQITSQLLKQEKQDADTKGLTLRVVVLDIDETLLTQDTNQQRYFKCPDAWKAFMHQETENDKYYQTSTVYLLGSFRPMDGGIYIRGGVKQRILVSHIAALLEKYSEYLNLYSIVTTGNDDNPYSEPECKVTGILDLLHNGLNIKKNNITIFDDQLGGVIEVAQAAGYNAVLIPEDLATADEIIRKSARPAAVSALIKEFEAPSTETVTPQIPSVTEKTPLKGAAKRKANFYKEYGKNRHMPSTANASEEIASQPSKYVRPGSTHP